MKRIFFTALLFMPCLLFSRPLADRDIDIFFHHFHEINGIIYTDQGGIFNVIGDAAVDSFFLLYGTIDSPEGNARNLAELQRNYHRLLNASAPVELDDLFCKIGWGSNGNIRFWSILFSLSYYVMVDSSEERIRQNPGIEFLYLKILEHLKAHNIFIGNDLQAVSRSFDAYKHRTEFDFFDEEIFSFDWQYGVNDPIQVDKDNAQNFHDYENDPRSIMAYFYSSFILGDERWREVITPDDSNPENSIPFDAAYEGYHFTNAVILHADVFGNEVTVWTEAEFEKENQKRMSYGTAKFVFEEGRFKLDVLYEHTVNIELVQKLNFPDSLIE